jgi:hypothetical protein
MIYDRLVSKRSSSTFFSERVMTLSPLRFTRKKVDKKASLRKYADGDSGALLRKYGRLRTCIPNAQ